MRTAFKNAPMAETDFLKWLEEEMEQSFIVAVKDFLGQFGFDIGKHLLTQEQSDAYRHTFTHFWYLEGRKDKNKH
jgi:hypothetical protein